MELECVSVGGIVEKDGDIVYKEAWKRDITFVLRTCHEKLQIAYKHGSLSMPQTRI